MPYRVLIPGECYSDAYAEIQSDTPGTGGNKTLTFTTVPAGEVWYVDGFFACDNTNTVAFISLRVVRDGNAHVVAGKVPTARWDGPQISMPMILYPGDYLQATLNGVTADDTIIAYAVGTKFKIVLE